MRKTQLAKTPSVPQNLIQHNQVTGYVRSKEEAEAIKALAESMGKLADAFGFKGASFTGISIN